MQEEIKKIEELVSHIKNYVNTKIAQAKFGAAEKTSDVLSLLIARALVALVFFFFLLLGSEAAAWAIGAYFGKIWLGLLMVAGFYLLAAWLIWLARERLLRIPIMNAIIGRLFKDENHNDEKD